MTDEALAERAAKGDDSAMAELITRMEPLAKAKAAKFPSLQIGEDDLLQEGMLGFLNAVRTFNPNNGSSFKSYASVCIQNSILSAVRVQLTLKSEPNRNTVPYEDKMLGSLAGNQKTPLDEISAREREEKLRLFICKNLSGKEKAVLEQRLMGKTQSAIAQSLGISPKAADNALQRIRKKLKEFN